MTGNAIWRGHDRAKKAAIKPLFYRGGRRREKKRVKSSIRKK
jgi:hypothetical protein